MTNDELIEAHEQLQKKYEILKQDHNTVISVVMDVLKVIGIIPHKQGDNILNKVLKKAKNVIMDMCNPFEKKKVEKEWECIDKLVPLIDKYMDSNGNVKFVE